MKGIHGRDFFVHKYGSLIILLYCFVCVDILPVCVCLCEGFSAGVR